MTMGFTDNKLAKEKKTDLFIKEDFIFKDEK